MRMICAYFDVSELTAEEECLLIGEVEAQAERTKADGYHDGKPDVPVEIRTVVFDPPGSPTPETRTTVSDDRVEVRVRTVRSPSAPNPDLVGTVMLTPDADGKYWMDGQLRYEVQWDGHLMKESWPGWSLRILRPNADELTTTQDQDRYPESNIKRSGMGYDYDAALELEERGIDATANPDLVDALAHSLEVEEANN